MALALVAASTVLGLGVQQAGVKAHAASGSGGYFVPVQGRILDTRSAAVGGYSTPMSPRVWRDVAVAGLLGIPASGVSAVQLSVSAVVPSGPGNVYLSKDLTTPQPQLALDYGYDAGSFTNTAVVALATSGHVQVMATTTTHVVIDVQGYYTAASGSTAGYIPVAPARIFNTSATQTPLAGGSTTTIQIGGSGGVPVGVSAVFANITVSDFASAPGYAVAYAADTARPTAALNYPLGAATSLGTTVALSDSGAMKLYLSAGPVNVIVDVVGYFTETASGGGFTPATGRVATKVPVAANGTVQVQVAGVSGVPDAASGVAAVAMEMQVYQSASSWGSLIVWASDKSRPNATSVNLTETALVSNFVTSRVGADNRINVFNNSPNPISIWVDLEGWYGSGTDATLVTGTVTDGGSPVADARVTLSAWPSSRTLAAQAEGATVSTLTLDTERSAASGGYVLSADLSGLPSDYVEDGGQVSLQVDIAGGGVSQTYNLSAAVPGTAAADQPDAVVGGSPDKVDFDLAKATVADTRRDAVEVSDDEAALAPMGSVATYPTPTAAATDGVPTATDNPDSLPPPPGPDFPCGFWTKVASYYNRPEHFLDAYAWSGAPATVVETTTATHELGVETNYGGRGWSLSGSITMDTHETNESGRTVYAGTKMYNGVNYSRYSQLCRYHDRSGAVHWYTNSELRPHGFFDLTEGQFEKPATDPGWTACSIVYPGDRKKKIKGSNVTYSAGISILGTVNTSSHASFASDMSIEWNVRAKSVYCGSTSDGPARSPRASVRGFSQTGPGRCGVPADGDPDGDTPNSVIAC